MAELFYRDMILIFCQGDDGCLQLTNFRKSLPSQQITLWDKTTRNESYWNNCTWSLVTIADIWEVTDFYSEQTEFR